MAVADVNGTSYWGGRTFVTDVGPTLLPNHGRQVSRALLVDPVEPHLLHDQVRWHDEHGVPQLEEERRLDAWLLPFLNAFVLFGETLTAVQIGGMVLTAAGVALANRG